MKQSTRIQKAKETLSILESGCYEAGGASIDIRAALESALEDSQLYRDEDFENILDDAARQCADLHFETRFAVSNTTVLKAAVVMSASAAAPVGGLNFASAKNPGGGFLNGAQAQEESLAVSSSLYATQMRHFALYEHNRARHTYLYSDWMIFSPRVVVFRNDDGELLTPPYELSILTSPATNIGAIRTNKPGEMSSVEATMLGRMHKVLAVFVHHGIRRLLLGAWGCGVFQNDPGQIAAMFAGFLKPGGKYSSCFEEVHFAVYDRSRNEANVAAFREHFGAT